jgi:hypothetical protein
MTLSAASAIGVAPCILSHIAGKESNTEFGNDRMFDRCLRYKLSIEDRRVVLRGRLLVYSPHPSHLRLRMNISSTYPSVRIYKLALTRSYF